MTAPAQPPDLAPYDSTQDTLLHIKTVQGYMLQFAMLLIERAMKHDASKLESPEKEFFDQYTPLLSSLEYGSDEYKQALKDLAPALEHHYRHNTHHPEHYPNGVEHMSLLDVVEMICDWKAASERHKTGDMTQSLRVNAKRFELTRQLGMILENTALDFKWIKR